MLIALPYKNVYLRISDIYNRRIDELYLQALYYYPSVLKQLKINRKHCAGIIGSVYISSTIKEQDRTIYEMRRHQEPIRPMYSSLFYRTLITTKDVKIPAYKFICDVAIANPSIFSSYFIDALVQIKEDKCRSLYVEKYKWFLYCLRTFYKEENKKASCWHTIIQEFLQRRNINIDDCISYTSRL